MTIFDLPIDLIFEIFLRLSVESLVRLSCVCKSWRTFIHSRNFINQHLNRSTLDTNGGCLLLDWDKEKIETLYSISYYRKENLANLDEPVSLNPPFRISFGFQIFGSFNGLLCVSGSTDLDHILWNPATRQFRELPKPGLHGLANQRMCAVVHGFGFVADTNDYKVVRILYMNRYVDVRVEVYSTNMDAWKEIDATANFPTYYDEQHGKILAYKLTRWGWPAFVNGVFYWMAYPYRKGFWNEKEDIIVGFNLVREVFSQFTMPTLDRCCKYCNHVQDHRLAELNGSLAMLHYCSCNERIVSISMMNECKKSWTKKLTIITSMISSYPFGCWKNSVVLSECGCGKLMLCNPDMKPLGWWFNVKEIKNFPWIDCPIGVFNYVESLVPVN